MTQIFFYHNAADRIAATATLIRKAYAQKKAILVYAPDAEIAGAIGRYLWMHPPTGFVPHVRSDSPLAGETPVLIADRLEQLPQDERLINLSAEVPPGLARFTSIIEVIGPHDAERLAGRGRARYYKDQGYEIHYIDLFGKS